MTRRCCSRGAHTHTAPEFVTLRKDGVLSPAQWLPKPATSQFPQLGRSLRETWSSIPNGGEGEVSSGRSGANRRSELKDDGGVEIVRADLQAATN